MAKDSGPSLGRQFTNGLWDDNPVLVQLLGMCPTLAVSNTLENAVVMGAAATFVVLCSNIVASTLRHLIKPHLRILVFTISIAGFVTIADLFLQAYLYEVSKKLGAFVPLIIVNCMIIGRAEVCAIRSKPTRAIADALGIGIGFTLALSILGLIREVLGSGSIWGCPVMPAAFEKWVIMVLPPGAFLTLGIVIGVVNAIRQRTQRRSAA